MQKHARLFAQPEQASGVKRPLSIISSTSPLDPASFSLLRKLQINVHEFFGSSETGAIATGSEADASFSLLPHLQRQGDGLERILAHGQRVRCELMDRLIWQDLCHFQLGPRLDRAVQVAGINVYPAQLQTFLAHAKAYKTAWFASCRAMKGTP